MRKNAKLNSETIEGIHYSTNKPVRIIIQDGLIADIVELKQVSTEYFVSPGLIDNQVNGYVGVDFSGESLGHEDIEKVTRALWREGVTGYLPTLITNGHKQLVKNFSILSGFLSEGIYNESIIGYHLEGPYISSEAGFVGCHPVEYVRKPDWREFMSYQRAAGGRIIQVTLAPEVEGATKFILDCVSNNIVVALGHTNANAEIIREAVRAGAMLSTHLGNGCANYLHRHENPLWPQLDADELTATIIADGHHLPHDLMRIIYRVKGKDKLILTSDMTFPAGMKPGKYFFGGAEVELRESGRLENVANDCLAGASFPLRTGVENMMKITRVSLADAIDMASMNPARIYGLSDRGVLAVNKRADIIVFALANNRMTIKETYVHGRKVFAAENRN